MAGFPGLGTAAPEPPILNLGGFLAPGSPRLGRCRPKFSGSTCFASQFLAKLAVFHDILALFDGHIGFIRRHYWLYSTAVLTLFDGSIGSIRRPYWFYSTTILALFDGHIGFLVINYIEHSPLGMHPLARACTSEFLTQTIGDVFLDGPFVVPPGGFGLAFC